MTAVAAAPRGPATREPTRRATSSRRTAVAVTAWAALLLAAVAWGQALQPGTNLYVGSLPPFIGEPDVRLHLALLPAAALAAVVVALGPALAQRMRWRPLLAASAVATAGWAVALAAADGWARLAAPLARSTDYRPTLPALDQGVGPFLKHYVAALPSYSTHTRGHPPGPVLIVWALDRIGLAGAGWQAAITIAVGASAVGAVAVTVRAVASEDTARAALPFLVLAPTALWVATSMDAIFLGLSAWGIALLALRRTPMLGGLLIGAALACSYGLLPLGAVALVVLRGRPRALLSGAVGVLVVLTALELAGFNWFAGAAATHREWAGGHGASRPYGYSVVGDLALLGVLVGPATAAALPSVRRHGVSLLVLAAAVAVMVSDLGGFTRLEVERIWLPFAPWLLVATAALHGSRVWLAAQAALALGFSAVMVSSW